MVCLSRLVLGFWWSPLVLASDRRRSSPAPTPSPKVSKSTLRLDNTGQVNLEVISHDSNFVEATGAFGSLTISHQGGDSSDAVGLFMDGITDPSMYMRSPNIGSDKPPEDLRYMVHGNLTAQLFGTKVSCGKLSVGEMRHKDADHSYWFLSSQNCVKGLPPEGGKDGQYRFVCECGDGVVVMFSQPGHDKFTDNLPMNIYDCSAIMAKAGRWVEVASSPGTQTLTYSHGVTHGKSVTDSKTWGSSTTHSVSAGFSFMGLSTSASVSHMTSESFTKSHTSTFSMSDEESYTTTMGAGTVWQFQMDVKDNCGLSGVKFNDLQLTQSSLHPPCCLPGHFVNNTEPEGECLEVDGEKYDVCDRNSSAVV